MGRGCWLIHLLLMCCLDTTLLPVNAQSVTISKVTPAAGNPVEGDLVQLRCQATGLMPGYTIEWTRLVIGGTQTVSIAWNETSVDPRYRVSCIFAAQGIKVEILRFIATKEDTGVIYNCRVRDSVELSSTIVVEAETISLSVLYFPSAMYPVCIPDGPITVQEGTTVNMSCTTEIGNPAVQMQIITSSAVYVWEYDRDSKEQMRSLQLSVTAANDGGYYQCKIIPDGTATTPFTGMERSCTMGPITVGQMTTPQHPMSTKESNVAGTPWLVAFIAIVILFTVSLIINIFLLIKHRHLKITKEKDTNVAKADPYMELQPTEDKNKVYMEPTYMKPVERLASHP